jgi:transposase
MPARLRGPRRTWKATGWSGSAARRRRCWTLRPAPGGRAKAELALRALGRKLDRKKLRDPRLVKRRVAQILADHKVAGLLQVQVLAMMEVEHRHLRPGRPRPGDAVRVIRRRVLQLAVARDKAAERREARTDGVFALVTNIVDAGKRETLEMYKYQPYLEKRFALTKSEYGVAPVFLKKPLRVVGLLHVYFIAIMVAALIERQVRAAMKAAGIEKIAVLPEGRSTSTPTAPRILENFTDVSWYEFQEGERVVQFPVELTQNQKLLLDLARVPRQLYA